jgi:UDP-N-acetylglucosamine 2-epimerase (non-hydrolysing)
MKISKLKVLTIVGTRPEIIRLSRVIAKLDEYFDHSLAHTGQNYDYELNQIFYDDLQMKPPDFILDCSAKNSAETIGNVIIKVDQLLEKVNPDAVLVLGDTNSCISILAAKRKKIPTFHMEAGNRCFDMRVPEEINRRLVDHIADINLTYSTIARNYLINEGLAADLIIKTGSPMFEVLEFYKEKIHNSVILSTKQLTKNNYFLVSAHREENIEPETSFKKLSNILNGLAEKYKIPVIVSTHPRTKSRIEGAKMEFNKLINFSKPLSFSDYNNLQINARCVISDSGTIFEEASILNLNALAIREAHERPEGMEEASAILTGLELDKVFQGVEMYQENQELQLNLVEDYSSPNVSEKIARIILSYTDYVNRVVWKKY